MADLKEVLWTEGKYSLHYAYVGNYRIGTIGYHGGKNQWKAWISVFDRMWEGHFETLDEAKEALVAMVELFIEEILA